MKKIQLLSILILFFTFFGVQCVVGQIRVPDNETGAWYVIYDTSQTSDHKSDGSADWDKEMTTYDNLKYPNTGTLTLQSYSGKGGLTGISYNCTLYLYQTINNQETKLETTIEKGAKWNDEKFTINQNATKIRFATAYGVYERRIRNIFLPMAPHILLKEITGDGTKTLGTGATATSTKTATIDFGEMLNTANPKPATIKIKSCLSTGNIATTLSDTPRGFSITGGVSGGGNTFVAINNGNDIIVTFDPTQAGVTTTTGSQTITETITISDADNTGNNVVITLTAKVNPPTQQNITWPEFNKTLRIGDVITLDATASSGLDITYTSNNTNIATINGNKMTIVGAGTATITASQGGNAEYAAAPEETKTITTKQYNVSNLRSTETGYKYIKLSWDAIGGADSYSIYEGDKLIGTTAETKYTITGVTYNESHTYKVKTNDAQSYTTQSSGSETTITTPAYPQIQNISLTDLQQNQVTVNWNPVTLPANHSLVQYHIHLYQPSTAGTFIKNYTTTETSYTIKDLIDNTEYTVYIDVEYQYTLNDNTITDTDWPWSSASFTTTSFITNDPFIGVKMYKGVWYYVNLNNDINITSNPMPIKLGYPCNYLTFKAFTKKDAGGATNSNSVGVKQDKEHTYTTNNWSFSTNEYTGETEIKTTTSAISIFKNSGNSNVQLSPLEVKNIWLTIEPHILLKENRYLQKTTLNATETATSTAEIDFGTIEVDYNQQVNVNFKSFLSVGNIKATITEDNDNVFSLKDGTKELHIAGNNTLEDIYSNDHSFTITFTPNKAQNEEYSGTLVINDDRHIVIITLKGKCIKRTPEITWINDKYISLGEYLAGAAFSTCGTVKYKLVDETKNNIIGIDNDFNLLEGKEKGENVEIIAMVDESEKWYSTQSIATFTVTDKIIQAIKWDQDFTIWKIDDEIWKIGDEKELTAEAITRETGEVNGNEITYSITDENSTPDESVAKIVDGNKLQIVGSGYTYITAHQQGNEEYAPTYMTKLVFVIETAGESENCLALEDIKGETYGDGGILSSGFDWGPFEFERELKTLGDKLSFKTTKVTDQTLLNTTGDYLVITDDLGNLVYNGNLGKEEKDIQLPDPEAKKLTFTLGGNLQVSISNIEVTPAKHITPDKNKIAFSETKVDNRAVEEINFEWANQPDLIIAKIEDDEAGVFSIDNKTAVFGNPDCGEHGISTVKVIFSPKEETDYTANLVVYVGDKPEPEKIPITGQGKKAEQAIYWLNITNLTTADKEVNLAYTTASSQQEITYTFISGDDVIEISNNSITVLGEGTFTLKAQQKNNNSYYDTKEITKTFTSSIGNIIFDNKANNNDWNTNGNWKPNSKLNLKRNITPSANVNAVISAEAVMSETNGEINNLTFENDGKLTINATSGLKANEVTNATADNLILKSSDKGNATFIYNSGTPSATVEMYSMAKGGETGGTPEWQYMGVAVDGATASNFPNAWLLKWTESENTTGDPWSDTPLAAGTTLAPWAGYSISQPQATTYTTKGALLRGDKEYSLSYTPSDDPDCGFNLLANSYTAPIDITKLTTSDFVNADACADACIILYNTGTYAEWKNEQGNSGEQAGQLTVIPIETVGATDLPKTIPSMQAFFVMAQENGATFTVNYDTDVAGATNHSNQMRAPRAENEFNVLKIMIEGENTRDRLYLLENEETSKAYDNGYEARKIFDAPRGHQMYATCEYGYASIDCSESFVGQTIGLKGDNEGEMLTISFDIDRLEGYESLYLYDKVTGKYVNIVAGEKYTFFGVKGADDNRFSIVTNPDDRNQTPPFVVIGEELAFDKSQINADNANIYIYDTSGRLLIIDKVNPYENYNIPNMPKGIYLVSMNGYTTKIVKK